MNMSIMIKKLNIAIFCAFLGLISLNNTAYADRYDSLYSNSSRASNIFSRDYWKNRSRIKRIKKLQRLRKARNIKRRLAAKRKQKQEEIARRKNANSRKTTTSRTARSKPSVRRTTRTTRKSKRTVVASISPRPAAKKTGLSFNDLVSAKKSTPKKIISMADRVMLRPSASFTKKYRKINARRSVASAGSVKSVLASMLVGNIFTLDGKLNSKGKGLVEFLYTVEDHGLRRSDYNLAALESGHADLESIAATAYVRLTNDLLLGRLDPKKADYDWHIKQNDKVTTEAILQSAYGSSDIFGVLSRRAPQSSFYQNLVDALKAYSRKSEWPSFPTAGPKLDTGISHRHVVLLRARLVASKHLSYNSQSQVFDYSLKKAVSRFQKENGLNSDGVVGRRTRVALSGGLRSDMMKIKQSLERLRWMPNVMPRRYVIVNTAGYELNLVENDRSILRMRTVVGLKRRNGKNHETPSFSKLMSHVVVNPRWHVPASIMSKEFLPKVQRRSDFFERNNYTLYSSNTKKVVKGSSVDWSQYIKGERIPYYAVQNSGSQNALGKIKFMLPNKYSIYLHDTPVKSLFKKDRRSFSHVAFV